MKHSYFMSSILGVMTCLYAVGCSPTAAPSVPKANNASAPLVLQAKQTEATEKTNPQLTEAECEEFAKKYEIAVTSGNAIDINSLIDWNAVLNRVTANVAVEDAFRRGFEESALASLKSQGLGVQLANAVQQGGTFKLLRNHTDNGEQRVLYRFVVANNGGVNYHDMILGKNSAGEVKAVDIYIFLSAETISQTMRRLYVTAAASQSRSFLEKLTGAESDLVKHIGDIQKMSESLRQGANAQVLATYNSLPDSLKKEKSIMIIQMQAAMKVDEKIYEQSMNAFRTAHPKDACLDLISLDFHILRKDYNEAMACLERLDKAVGGDPYLNVMRCGIYMTKGDTAQATKLCEESIAKNPEIVELYWTMISISLSEKKYDQTVTWLNRIQKECNVVLDDLKANPEYAAFVKSPEYSAWIDSHKK